MGPFARDRFLASITGAVHTSRLPKRPHVSSTTRRRDQDEIVARERSDAPERALANGLPQIIWSSDAQGRVQWINDPWFDFTGLSEHQTFHDKGAYVAVHPDDRDELARRWGHALETSEPTEIEFRIRNNRGEYRWHLARVAPVRDATGHIVRWLGAAFDIQPRRAAEDALRASERRFQTVFQMSPQPLAITREADGRFVALNDALAQLFGFSRDEMIGKTSTELGLWSDEERARFVESLRRDAGSQRNLEVSKRTKDGRVVRVIFSSARSEIDGVPCLVNAVTDVTGQRATEDALRKADRRKDEFLALLSHELRNPLTPILTSARLLERRFGPEAHQDVDVIVRQVKHLGRLVDDLLDVSRLARGAVSLNKRQLDLVDVVLCAVEATAQLFEERGHRLDIALPSSGLEVEGDEVRLTQVVDNLLSNAARYTLPGGVVTVTGVREDHEVVLSVRDSGVGIDPALLPDLFDTFVQGTRGPDRAEGGLGIGLSLVRALTELHGGTASVHSDGPGRGSEFTVRLPSAVKSEDSVRSNAHRGNGAGSAENHARVLVVDDHGEVVEGLRRLLSVLGYDVRAAKHPIEAIELAETFRPEIAILDIGLPTMDGYALARELRAKLADSPPTLVALTGYGQPHDRQRSEASGFALHLVKPVDIDELIGALAPPPA
jgi:PAS domain S-box-containing protein